MVYSLVTVNNNVSLLSITIAPSAYIASVTLAFVFIYLYVIQISWKPTLLPNLQYFSQRSAARQSSRNTATGTGKVTGTDKVLPALPAPESDALPTTPPHPHFGYPSHHSGFRSDDTESDLLDPVDSPGGYSPPAWRRLGNGNRDSGFWRKTNDILGTFPPRGSRASSPAYDDADLLGDDVLARAVRTRLPTGSMSPDKRRSPSPAPKHEETTTTTTLKLDDVAWKGSSLGEVRSAEGPDNYIRFALRAEVQQRTEPIERAVHFLRARWAAATKSWSSFILSVLVAVLSATALRNLFQPATPRPTVREKTVRNKGVLVEHNGRLLTLKANLESLRRKLVSPLVRSVNSSTLTLDEQVRGLETVGGYLEGVRARQKGKLMAMLYGARGTDERGLP
ncbi:GDP-mannose transporter [Verticillium dahliae VDG1]|nr:GDP-mannose transporter [Verticillium dahliae VDG1]